MGIILSRIWQRLSGFQDFKICMVGLDAAGKTTILYKLHLGEVVSTYPTIGSNVEEIVHKNMRFQPHRIYIPDNYQCWDIGGQKSLRPTWSTYFVNTQALIMVVDSSDIQRLDDARAELHSLLESEDLKTACILIFANKQDLKGTVTPAEISETLSLHSIKTHDWHIQGCSAITGDGLYQGLDWISKHVRRE